MNIITRTWTAVLCAASLLSISACVSPGAAQKAAYTPGTYTVAKKGYGGEVKVAVTVDADSIIGVTVVGDKETPAVGGRALKSMAEGIAAKGEKVEAVSGATYTSAAVKAALSEALARARGEKPASALSMKNGTYEASARGFHLVNLVPVTVTVADNRIADIVIGKNSETNGKPQAVREKLIPRIMQHQSLAVDGVSGATATSNAVLKAVRDCLIKAGADESALYAEIPSSTAKEEYVVDVAVVGFGGSGMTSALSAAEKGAKVMVLEKAGRIGGTSAVTGGPMAVNPPSQVSSEIAEWNDPAIGKKRVKKAGENLVDAEALYREWTSYTKVDGVQHAKENIIAEIIAKSGSALDWLAGYGFVFENAVGFLGNKWAIYTTYRGNKSLTEGFFDKALDSYANKLGGSYLLETEAVGLIVEGGKVVGVKARKQDGTSVVVRAKSVILATGGFGGSDSMMKKYLGESWKLYGMAQNDGAGIRMATEVGAATYNIDMAPMSHFSAPPVIFTQFDTPFDNDIPYGMINTSEALAVDKSGKRFVNEMDIGYGAYVGGARFYSIYSKNQIDILRGKGFGFISTGRYLNRGGIKADTPMKNIDAVLEAGIKAGFIFKAPSLDALAARIGAENGRMNGNTLTASVAAYNEGIKSGKDAMNKKAERFARLGTVDPESEYFVAVTGAPYIYSTCGGLDVNQDMQVLTPKGEVIPGLYAVGTDSMGVLFTNKKGYANFGGVAQGYCFTSGRIAGEKAAR